MYTTPAVTEPVQNHGLDKVEEEKRRLFEERMKSADTALEELESGIQKCKVAISKKPDATEEIEAFSTLVEKTKTDISNSLALQQTELKQAKTELEILLQKIKVIESSPVPSILQLKGLLESTPKTHLDSLPTDVVELLRKYIMDEEAKAGIIGHAAAVGQYLASWLPAAKVPKQTNIQELLGQLKKSAEEKLETTKETIEKNITILAKLEEVSSETEKLKKTANRRKKLSSLDDLDAKISNIRSRLKSYSKSYVRLFFGYLFKTKTYKEYRNVKKELGDVLVAKEKFEQKISENLAQEDMDAQLEVFEQQKKGLHVAVDDVRRHAQKFRKETRIGDIGLEDICHDLSDGDIPINYENLKISHNDITERGTEILANTLAEAQTRPGFKVHEIDLTGNSIGTKGLEALQQGLSRNFTVTTLNYDAEYATRVNKENIDKHLLMNRYLQGLELSGYKEQIETLFGSEANLKQQAIEKVKSNYSITIFPSRIHEDEEVSIVINQVMQQNVFFLKLRSENPALELHLAALKLDPKRYVTFMETAISRDKKEVEKRRGQIYTAVAGNLLKLRSLNLGECQVMLQSLFPVPLSVDLAENIKLLSTIIGELPKEESDAIALSMQDILQESFTYLGTQTSAEFKAKLEEKLEAKRQEIAKSAAGEQKRDVIHDKQQRRGILETTDSMLHQDLTDPIALKKFQLKKLVADHLVNLEQQTFAEFIKIYNEISKEITKEELALFLSEIDASKLVSLINTDFPAQGQEMAAQLKKLDGSARIALLEVCFKDEPDCKKKAILVSSMIDVVGSEAVFQTEERIEIRDNYLHGAFIAGTYYYPKHDYAKLKRELEDARKEAVNAGNTEIAKAAETALQNALQAEVRDILTHKDGFTELKAAVKKGDFTLLRQPPEGVTGDAKEYIDVIAKGNEQHSAIFDYSTPKVQLEKFLEIYSKIKSPGERQKYLDAFLKTEGVGKLVILINTDFPAQGQEMAAQLKKLDGPARIALLEVCFKDELDFKKKAILVSSMIDAVAVFQTEDPIEIRDNYLHGAFIVGYLSYKHSYDKLKSELEDERKKAVNAGNTEIAKAAETALQNALQAEVRDILSHEGGLAKLKVAVEKGEFALLRQPPEDVTVEGAKEYIDIIARGNELRSAISDYPTPKVQLEKFLEIYLKIKLEERQKYLDAFLKTEGASKLVSLIDTDFFTQGQEMAAQLKKLDEPVRIALLEVCFKNAPEFKNKLEAKRQEIAKSASSEQKSAMLDILDSTLNPGLGQPGSVEFKTYQLQKLITEHPTDPAQTLAEFMSLYDLVKEENIESLCKAPPLSENAQQNLKLFITMISKIPAERMNDPVMKDVLQKAFAHLSENPEVFKSGLEEKRKKVLVDITIHDEQQRREILETIDSTLHQNLTNPIALKKFQLKKLVADHLVNSEQQTFAEFIKIYNEISNGIPKEELTLFLSEIDASKLVSLINTDFPAQGQGMAAQLKNLKEPARIALLEVCFKDEPDFKKKAILVSSMIDAVAVFQTEDPIEIRDNYLHGAFIVGYLSYKHSYDKLKSELEDERKKAVNAGNTEIAKAAETALQNALQAEVRDILSHEGGLAKLKVAVEKGEFALLRQPPEDVTVEGAKEYIDIIARGNELRSAISDYPTPKVQLEKFLEIYLKIKLEERQKYLDAFLKIEGVANEFLKLLKDDINLHNCENLKKLTESEMSELLMVGLKGTPHAHSIATLTSSLIKIDPPVPPEYWYGIFGYPGYFTAAPKLSLQQYVDKLAELSKTRPEVLNVFSCLNGNKIPKERPPLSLSLIAKEHPLSFKSLQGVLEKNYTLMDIKKLNLEKATPDVRKYVEFICQRNLLKNYLATSDLDKFIAEYASVKVDDCKKALQAVDDKLKILQIITTEDLKDSGKDPTSCERLRKLDPERRIMLLEHCFSLNDSPENAHKKAVLISTLLETPKLFDRTDKTSQAIKSEIYWAITPYGSKGIGRNVPYYDLSYTQSRLQGILDKIPSGDEALSGVRTGLSKALATLAAPEPAKVETLQPLKL